MTMTAPAEVLAYWDSRAHDGYDDQPGQDPAVELWTKVLPPLVERLVGPGADVLDVGCGTGFCARLLSASGHRLTGADASAGMLAVAADRAAREGCAARFVQADATEVDVAAVDLVIARNLLWTLPAPLTALRHWRTLLRPGGAVLITDACWGESGAANTEAPGSLSRFDRAYRPVTERLPLAAGLDGDAATALLRTAGFGVPADHADAFETAPYPEAPGFFLLSAPVR